MQTFIVITIVICYSSTFFFIYIYIVKCPQVNILLILTRAVTKCENPWHNKGQFDTVQSFATSNHLFTLTHYQTTNFRLSKSKDFTDDNLKFEENGRNLYKPVENTVAKGEIARKEQFLLFPRCFRKACFSGASKGVIAWEWVKALVMNLNT